MFGKNKKFGFIFLGIIVLTILFVLSNSYSGKFVRIDIDDKFYNNYHSTTVTKEEYENKCKFEDENQITFPRTNPYEVFLHSNRFLSSKKKLNQEQTQVLLTILNDSASYVWGEFGTPETHYYFTFVNSENEIIGVTTIDLIGMAYSEPYIGKMKWGQLANKEQLHNLIYDIENNPSLNFKLQF